MPQHTRNIVILAMIEGFVLISAVARLAIHDGGIDLSQRPTLIWFVGVALLAGLSVAQYVVRSSLLMPRLRAGERVDEELKQVLGVSAAILALAAMISIAGPGMVAKVLG